MSTGTIIRDRATEHAVAKRLISHYVGQLLNGCGNASCRQLTCDTGRRNASTGRPVRSYTPRSARALALTLVSQADPTARLCKYYDPEQRVLTADWPEGPLDPNSLVQQLCATTHIKNLIVPATGQDAQSALLRACKVMHSELDQLEARSLGKCPGRTATILLRPLHFLARYMAAIAPDMSVLAILDEYVQQELAYSEPFCGGTPSTRAYSNDRLLDLLNCRAALELLSRALNMAATRIKDEHDHYRKALPPLGPTYVQYSRKPLGRFSHIFFERSFSAFDEGIRALFACDLDDRRRAMIMKSTVAAIIWVKKALFCHLGSSARIKHDNIAAVSLAMMEYFTHSREWDLIEAFRRVGVISGFERQTDSFEAAKEYEVRDDASTHLWDFEACFTVEEKAFHLRVLNHLRMREAHVNTTFALKPRNKNGAREPTAHNAPAGWHHGMRSIGEQFLVLSVSRENALSDAMDQLWRREKRELTKPLRVRLGEETQGEMGHDLGGVQTEFFNLVCRQLFHPDLQIFAAHPSTGLSHLCSGSLQPLYKFELCGLLFGLALYNGITLPVDLALAFYASILGPDTVSVFDLAADMCPEETQKIELLKRGKYLNEVDRVLRFKANGLELYLSPDPDMSAAFNMKVHSIRCVESDGKTAPIDIADVGLSWPGWRFEKADGPPAELSTDNYQSFISYLVSWIVYGNMLPQMDAFNKGFFTVISPGHVCSLRPSTLRAILEGSATLDIKELRRVTHYDGYCDCDAYIQSFWTIVEGWPEAKQKQLIKFVTAVERFPAAGLEAGNFHFSINRVWISEPKVLPTSSTCFGVLYLPMYPDSETLERKLSIALEAGLGGFGAY